MKELSPDSLDMASCAAWPSLSSLVDGEWDEEIFVAEFRIGKNAINPFDDGKEE
jgi:hypothetical protein